MVITMSVSLPRDAASVPVARRVLVNALNALGAEPSCRDDVELALAEACANVLNHAEAGEEYEVVGSITDDRVVLEVRDTGVGFDSAGRGLSDADESSESGRGIQLMRALVDSVSFTARPEAGTVVHLEKMLSWQPDAMVKAVSSAASTGTTIPLGAAPPPTMVTAPLPDAAAADGTGDAADPDAATGVADAVGRDDAAGTDAAADADAAPGPATPAAAPSS